MRARAWSWSTVALVCLLWIVSADAQVAEKIPVSVLMEVARKNISVECLDVSGTWSLETALSGGYYIDGRDDTIISLAFTMSRGTKHYLLLCWRCDLYYELMLFRRTKAKHYECQQEVPFLLMADQPHYPLNFALRDVTGDGVPEVLLEGGRDSDNLMSWLCVFRLKNGYLDLISPLGEQVSERAGRPIVETALYGGPRNVEMISEGKGPVIFEVPPSASGHYNEDRTDYIVQFYGSTKRYRYENGKISLFEEIPVSNQ